MRNLLKLAVLGSTLAAGVGLATAQAPGPEATHAQWLPIDEVARSLRLEGYEVRKIEIDDGRYEAEAINPEGTRVEV